MSSHRTFARMPFVDSGLEGSLHEVIAVRENWHGGFVERPKRLSWLVVLLNEQGESRHSAGYRSVVVSDGAVVLQPGGIVCADSSPDPSVNSYLLTEGLLVDALERAFRSTQPPPTEVYPVPPAGFAVKLPTAIDTVFAQPVGHPWEMLGNVVGLLYSVLQSPPLSRAEYNLLSRARRLVEGNVTNLWPLAEFAAALGIHPKALGRWFRQHVGAPPKVWVGRQRVQMALGMLRRLSVSTTAELPAFADVSGFSCQFRTVIVQPPSELLTRPPSRALRRVPTASQRRSPVLHRGRGVSIPCPEMTSPESTAAIHFSPPNRGQWSDTPLGSLSKRVPDPHYRAVQARLPIAETRWRPRVTPRERLLTAVRGGVPNVVPVSPTSHWRFAHRLPGRYHCKDLIEIHKSIGSIFHCRPSISIGPNSYCDVRWGMEMRVIARNGTETTYERIIRNRKGTLRAVRSIGFDTADPTLGFQREYFVKKPEDWDTVEQ